MAETRRLLEAACALSHTLRANGVPHAFHGSLFVAVLANSPQADVRLTRRSSSDGTAFGDLITVQEIFCIVEGGTVHPFRRVRQALTGNADLSITPSPWSNRYTLIHFRLWPESIPLKRWRSFAQAPRKIQSLRPSSRGSSLYLFAEAGPRTDMTCIVILYHADRNPSGGRVWPATPRCAHGGDRQSGTIPDHFRIRTGKIERVDDVRYVLRPCSSCSTSDALMSSLSRGSDRDAQDIVFIMTRYWNSIDINRIAEHDMDRFVEMVGAAAPGWAAIKRKYGM